MTLPISRRNLLLLAGGTLVIFATIISVSWQHLPELTGQVMMEDDNSYMEMPDDGDDSTSCTSYDDCPESILPSGCEEGGDKREGTAWHCDDATNTCVSTPFPCSDSSESSETSESSQGSCPSGSHMATADTANGTDDECVVNGGECGNGIAEEGEECEEEEPKCGNGIVEQFGEEGGYYYEECDDGMHCSNEESCNNHLECKGIGDEECKPRDGDGCNSQCYKEINPNGKICCNAIDGSCSKKINDDPLCKAPLLTFRSEKICKERCGFCGDGTLDYWMNEECDDGNKDDGDGCSKECLPEIRCPQTDYPHIPIGQCSGSNEWQEGGKYYENQYERHDSWEDCVKKCSFCGNGIIEGKEECDDGGFCDDPDAYIQCLSHSDCENLGNELCTPRSFDGCSEDCTIEKCGNGIVDEGEECDDGKHCRSSVACNSYYCSEDRSECKPRSWDGCSKDCTVEKCGNGVVDEGEECDDGKHCRNGLACYSYYCSEDESDCLPRSFDGCTEDCKIESREARCIYEWANGMLRKCCQEEFVPGIYNCTNFAENFHELCYEESDELICMTASITCSAAHLGHAANVIFNGEQWCFMEPQGRGLISPCFDDPYNPSQEAICNAIDQEGYVELDEDGNCPCFVKVSPVPITPNTDPEFCIDNEDNLEDCMFCCSVIGYHNENEKLQNECEAHCQDEFGGEGEME